MSATSGSVLATTQEVWIRNQVTDSFFDSTDVAYKIYNSPGKKEIPMHGTKAVWTPEIAEAAPAASVASGATVVAASNEFVKKAELDWKFLATLSNRDKQDFDVFNSGASAQIDMFRAWMDNLKKSMKKKFASSLWSNTLTANDMISLSHAIDDTFVYAGLDPAVETKWKSQKTNLAGVEVTIMDIVALINKIRWLAGGKADMIVCGFDRYQALESEAFGAIRHPSVGEKSVTELGLPTFTIHGAQVIVDPFLDAEAANGAFASPDPRGIAGANKVYILSTPDLAFVPMSSDRHVSYKSIGDMIYMSPLVDLFPITGAMKYQVGLDCGGQIFVINRRTQGVIVNAG